MPDSGWVALGGVVAGVVGKGGLDWILAAGRVRADREARAEARRDKRAERRDDLQRESLLAAQEAAMDLVVQTAAVLKERITSPDGYTSAYVMSSAVGEAYRATQGRIRLLYTRLADQQVRAALLTLQTTCHSATVAETHVLADQLIEVVGEPFHAVQDRAGQLVRELDGV